MRTITALAATVAVMALAVPFTGGGPVSLRTVEALAVTCILFVAAVRLAWRWLNPAEG